MAQSKRGSIEAPANQANEDIVEHNQEYEPVSDTQKDAQHATDPMHYDMDGNFADSYQTQEQEEQELRDTARRNSAKTAQSPPRPPELSPDTTIHKGDGTKTKNLKRRAEKSQVKLDEAQNKLGEKELKNKQKAKLARAKGDLTTQEKMLKLNKKGNALQLEIISITNKKKNKVSSKESQKTARKVRHINKNLDKIRKQSQKKIDRRQKKVSQTRARLIDSTARDDIEHNKQMAGKQIDNGRKAAIITEAAEQTSRRSASLSANTATFEQKTSPGSKQAPNYWRSKRVGELRTTAKSGQSMGGRT